MQIDLCSIESNEQLHKHLSSSLLFPDFYGMNWDAFWDCITDLIVLPETIEFLNSQSLKAKLPESYTQLKECFTDLALEYPNINCHVIWH
ncbi:barstar family protein [Psychromonas aquimarina]|uniref:barstar family protein n=1 Tax=Psychromonas aquimarina TaxID=444919 RepID=UPI0004907F55